MKQNKEKENELTQQKLKEVLDYNPDTGKFYWKEAIGYRIKKGQEAGYKDPLGYVYIRINRKNYLTHRLVWLYIYGEWPKDQIDHINRDKSDNRVYNLRDVTHKLNHRNKWNKGNKSGVKGVILDKYYKRWKAYICVNYKCNNLGRFDNFLDAVKARYEAESKLNWQEAEESSAKKYLDNYYKQKEGVLAC